MRHVLIVSLLSVSVAVADPCISGTPVGQRPGPYSFLVATGQQRGQQTCYICETEDRPAVIVFARQLNDPLKKLLTQIDSKIAAQPKDTLRAWTTILGEKVVSLDELAKWGKETGLKNLPLGVFDDPVGPPSYKLNQEADVTVLLFVNKKVIANFAYRPGELNEEQIKRVTSTIPKLLEKK